MLVVIDVGNTHTVLGIYRDEQLLDNWRISTSTHRTRDEYIILLQEFLRSLEADRREVAGMMISCVVPPVLNELMGLASKYFHFRPLVVGPGIKTGLPILIDNPREVGADRIVNAVAAFQRHKRAMVIIDFGTATTFDCVSQKGEYIGGVIAPGMHISMEALCQRASKLPRVELIRPPEVVGRNTVQCMQSGVVYGYLSLVEGLVARIKEELKLDLLVIATGGLARVVARETEVIDEVDEFLTLEGLKYLYDLNTPNKSLDKPGLTR
ncbi:MAG: type III pantothenate kinase [Deltaproteobacteria bacterium]|nr:type III pantothenate kinase [Deltaproteobacteria bacterium]